MTLVSNKDHYRFVCIPKFKRIGQRKVINGTRTLSIPDDELMAAQIALKNQLKLMRLPPSKNAHAYIAGRDILSMARPHVGKKYLVRIDLKDFFPSLTEHMVITGLAYWKMPRTIMSQVANLAFLGNGLPQGSPVSPALSNIAVGRLDASIRTMLKTWHKKTRHLMAGKERTCAIEYTRYADDLIFSSNYPRLFQIVRSIKHMCKAFGLSINPDKVFCLAKPHRLEVCGVVVNEKLSKSRGYRRELRSLLHRIILDRSQPGRTRGYRGTYLDINFASLRSKVAHVTFVCKTQGEPLQKLFDIAYEVHTTNKDHWSTQAQEYDSRYRTNNDPAGRLHDGAGRPA
jgi:hypothetical protein